MNLDEEILARINAAKSFDSRVEVSDFQLRFGRNGTLLINAKTGKAQLRYDDYSELNDLKELGMGEWQLRDRARSNDD